MASGKGLTYWSKDAGYLLIESVLCSCGKTIYTPWQGAHNYFSKVEIPVPYVKHYWGNTEGSHSCQALCY